MKILSYILLLLGLGLMATSMLYSFYLQGFILVFGLWILSSIILWLSTKYNEALEDIAYPFIIMGLLLVMIFAILGAKIHENDLEKTLINIQPVQNVKFIDDIHAVAYIASPSGQESSEILNKTEYWKFKSEYLEGKPCHLTSVNYYNDSFVGIIIDKNDTYFECF